MTSLTITRRMCRGKSVEAIKEEMTGNVKEIQVRKEKLLPVLSPVQPPSERSNPASLGRRCIVFGLLMNRSVREKKR